MPIELDFILCRSAAHGGARRVAPRAPAVEGGLRATTTPGSAAAMTKHYEGDDADLEGPDGRRRRGVRRLDRRRRTRPRRPFFDEADHPTLGRRFRDCGYPPMVELLRYLEANGSRPTSPPVATETSCAPIAAELYGIPPERVIGSRTASATGATGPARSSTSPSPTYSTTAPRSPSGSGAGSAAGPLLASATRTATSRCSASPRVATVAARPPRRRRARVRLRRGRRAGARGGLGRRQREGRLGHGLRRRARERGSFPAGCAATGGPGCCPTSSPA